jgi:hypothetical protein
VKGLFMGWLEAHRPDLVERYRALYPRGAYLPEAEQERLQALLREPPAPWRSPPRRATRRVAWRAPEPPAAAEPAQPSLF